MPAAAVIGCLVLLAACADDAQTPTAGTTAPALVSEPFRYSGYSSPQFSAYERESVYVPMSDGVGLAVSIFRPTPASDDARYPVILWYLPGHRESIDPSTGEVTPAGGTDSIEFFTSYGYVYVLAEMRGSGASEGVRFDRSPQIGVDGAQLVEWLGAQPWSNGSVGMIGSSYQGFSQFATAARRPPALKAIFPEIAGLDEYSIMFRPGGILNEAMTSFATSSIARDDENWYVPAERPGGRSVLPSAPVIDEDRDGELADEIPLDRDGSGTFLDDGDPVYSDGNAREDIYYRATLAHRDNTNITADMLAAAPFRDSVLPGSDYTYVDLGPGNRIAEIAASSVAVYYRGGWFDYHARDATLWFASLVGSTPVRLMMAPTAHSGFADAAGRGAGPYWPYLGLTETRESLDVEKLRFFDRYLKGIDNGIDREPPVYIHVAFRGWRFENEWPLARQQATPFYFHEGGVLSTGQPSAPGSDDYAVDLHSDSRHDGGNRWNFRLAGLAEPMLGTGKDASRQTYTTAPLTQALEVTGHPVVELWLDSTAADGDVFVYLEDVDTNGEAVVVTDGMLRANFAALTDNDTIGADASAIDVRPELPWQGFRESDYFDRVFDGDAPVRLTLDLLPTAWTFRRGHRIRVALAGADWPTFQLHPALAPGNDPADPANVSPVLTIHRDPLRASNLRLPVIPD
jgi:putative CocE/NonD family hydrolase